MECLAGSIQHNLRLKVYELESMIANFSVAINWEMARCTNHVQWFEHQKLWWHYRAFVRWGAEFRYYLNDLKLRPELSTKWMLSILSDVPLTRKSEKNVDFSILQIFKDKIDQNINFAKLPSAKLFYFGITVNYTQKKTIWHLAIW